MALIHHTRHYLGADGAPRVRITSRHRLGGWIVTDGLAADIAEMMKRHAAQVR